MKFPKQKNHMVDFLFILLLFCVFTISALAVIGIGADVYKSAVKRSDENYELRTSLSYIAEKIRQNDLEGGISVADFHGTTALALAQTYNDTEYVTYIYKYENELCELFMKKGSDASLDSGQALIEISDFTIDQIDDSLYKFTSTAADGRSVELYISPRCS